MISSIVYIVSFILLVSGVMLYPKEETTTMFLTQISMAVISVMCIGVIFAQVYTLIGIPVNLKTVSAVYLLFGLMIFVAMAKRKKLQKLYIDKWQMICVCIFTVVFAMVELKTYSYSLRPAFCNYTDASAHFEKAMNVVRSEKVDSMPFASFYNAMLIEILSPLLAEIKYYKAFILADTLHYYFEMIFFYSLTLEMNKKKTTKYIAPIITLLYWLGYPLYSYVIGNSVYWSWGVILFGYTIYLIKKIVEDKGNVYCYVGVVLGVIGVAQSYMLFIPFVAMTMAVIVFPQIYSQILKSRKVRIILLISVLAFLAVAVLTFYAYFGNDLAYVFVGLKQYGMIYSNLIGDFLLIIPIAIAYKLYTKENNMKSTYLKSLIVNGVCLIPMLAMVIADAMSVYYYSKLYYIVWFFAWITVINAFDDINVGKETFKYVRSYIIVAVVILASCFLRLDKLIPLSLIENDKVLPGTSLYRYNLSSLDVDYEDYEFSSSLMELYEYVKYIYSDNGKSVLMVNYVGGDEYYSRPRMYRAMTGQPSTDFPIERVDDNEWKNVIEGDNSYDYFVLSKDTKFYNNNKEYIRQYSIVYENDIGIVIEKP